MEFNEVKILVEKYLDGNTTLEEEKLLSQYFSQCEELPDGSVLLSSRKGYGRYFNVFHYTNFEKAEGYWDGAVATDQVGNLKFGSNDTNGEPLRIGNVLFQSVPTGNNRSGVSIFYKELSDAPATYTPTELSNGWRNIFIHRFGLTRGFQR